MMASVRPPARAAGSPTTTATAAPTRPPKSSASPRSRPADWVIQPPAAPPMAAKAICPRLTWPAQPVRSTSEIATVAMIAVSVAMESFPADSSSGSATNSAATAP